MFFLGIDGGGTKTDYLLINEKGSYCSHYRTLGIDYVRKGQSSFSELLREGINKVCDGVSINPGDIKMSFIGVPGYGDEILTDRDKINDIIKQIIGHERYIADNDALAGWAGSLACRPGINIVAGTGSIGFGVDAYGNKARSGGWGNIIGGDEGSAYWLGCKMIQEFTKQSDGRSNRGHIYAVIRDHFKLDSDFEIMNILYNDIKMERNEIAKLAMLLFKAAQLGDAVSISIFSQAGHELGLIVNSIARELDFKDQDKIAVSYSGGVFKAGKFVMEPFEKSIEESRINLLKPMLSPVSGAAYYAISSGLKAKPEKGVIENLKKCDEIMK